MKAETDPITADEWLVRLVWETRITEKVPVISPNAFEPRPQEIDGISFFRVACLNAPADALNVIAAEKRSRYAIVQIPISMLVPIGLSVRSSPIAVVPGHVIVPELNIIDYKSDKARFTPIKLRLAQIASQNILHRPGSAP